MIHAGRCAYPPAAKCRHELAGSQPPFDGPATGCIGVSAMIFAVSRGNQREQEQPAVEASGDGRVLQRLAREN